MGAIFGLEQNRLHIFFFFNIILFFFIFSSLMYKDCKMPIPYRSQVLVGQLALVSEGWGTHTRSRDTACIFRGQHTVLEDQSAQREGHHLIVLLGLEKKKIVVYMAGVAQKVCMSLNFDQPVFFLFKKLKLKPKP